MPIGFMTNVLVKHGMKTLNEIAAWGADSGFDELEVGPMLPLDEKAYAQVQGAGRIRITALTYCRNFLSTDREEAELHLEELKKRIRFAGALGIEKIVTSTGIDKTLEEGVYDKADSIRKIPARSLELVQRTFEPIAKLAEENKVKICFENCPLMGNIAISPVLWDKLLQALPSDNVGLAYDPSHLVWQMIDPYQALEEFRHKIYHFHAKDTVIHKDILSRTGILTDFSWWQYKVPGTGELDWNRLMSLLQQAGYTGTLSIEHEDAAYEDNLAQVQEGLLLGKDNIKKAF